MSNPPVVVLTAPAAAGKNSVARALADRVPALAVVDVDSVRWMVLKPHVAPWTGDEGRRQLELGVRNACQLARNFVDAGFPAVVLDVVTAWSAPWYRSLLSGLPHQIVQFLPPWSVVEARFVERARTLPSATLEEARIVYDWQVELQDVDARLDSGEMAVGDLVDLLVPLVVPPYNSRLQPTMPSLRSGDGG